MCLFPWGRLHRQPFTNLSSSPRNNMLPCIIGAFLYFSLSPSSKCKWSFNGVSQRDNLMGNYLFKGYKAQQVPPRSSLRCKKVTLTQYPGSSRLCHGWGSLALLPPTSQSSQGTGDCQEASVWLPAGWDSSPGMSSALPRRESAFSHPNDLICLLSPVWDHSWWPEGPALFHPGLAYSQLPRLGWTGLLNSLSLSFPSSKKLTIGVFLSCQCCEACRCCEAVKEIRQVSGLALSRDPDLCQFSFFLLFFLSFPKELLQLLTIDFVGKHQDQAKFAPEESLEIGRSKMEGQGFCQDRGSGNGQPGQMERCSEVGAGAAERKPSLGWASR